MTERPILFGAAMVRAILDGRKTATRRVVKPQPTFDRNGVTCAAWARRDDVWLFPNVCPEVRIKCPYGRPGEQLWVRETWQSLVEHDKLSPSAIPEGSDVQYPASYDGWVSKQRPSIHMPRWMSRIQLEVTGVRVERLNAISEADAVAEGISGPYGSSMGIAYTARDHYEALWESINGAGAWDANPWVWVVEFLRIERGAK
jgi:hypothetical protein